ncbi:MAG: ribonuclease HI [Proteobacteria bacterium]|nr:ribonuclease HI [Pseudomonadota bacterium]
MRYSLKQGAEYEYRVPEKSLEPLSAWKPKGQRDRSKSPSEKKSPASSGKKTSAKSQKTYPDPKTLPGDTIVAYTDGGSRGNPGPAGSGVVLWYNDREKLISEYLGETTNNVAELTAILLALKAIKKPHWPVRLYTDSKYAHGVLFLGWKAKKNTELIQKILEKIKKFKDLEAYWVPGHALVPGNEKADQLANEAMDQGLAETGKESP